MNRTEASNRLMPWVPFAGCVLVIVGLCWARAVLVPIAPAILLTFVLTPPIGWLERWAGRAPVVGTLGPSGLADESTQLLRDAGAVLVPSTLAETRMYLAGLAETRHREAADRIEALRHADDGGFDEEVVEGITACDVGT